MAIKSWYLTATTSGGWRTIDEATQAAANNADGWVVSTGSTNSSEFEVGAERAATTFTGNTVPDGSLDTTLKDAFRSTNAINGNFANANWTFHFVVRAVTTANSQAGRCVFRVFKADADGSNATEISAGQHTASTVTQAATGTDYDSTLVLSLAAFSMVNQYLFIQIAWQRTGAGSMTTNDANWRTGSSSSLGTRIDSSTFLNDYRLTASAGSVAITGTAATLKRSRIMAASAGSVAIAGTAALFWYGQIKNAIRFATDHDGLYTTSIASHNPNEQTVVIFIRYRVTRVGTGVQMCALSMEANNGTAHYFLIPETTANVNTVESHDSFNGGGFIVGTAVLAAAEWWCVAETTTLTGTETALYTQKIGTGGAMLRETNNDHGNFTDMTRLIVGTDDAQPIINSPQNEWLDGDIAGIKLWDHALTATELESEKRSLDPVKVTGLKEWWKPDSGGSLVPQLGNFGAFSNIAGTFGFPSGTNGRTFRTDGPALAGSNLTNRTLTASSGSVAVTGTAATLKFGRLVSASDGSVALTGTAATLKAGRKVAADPGAVAVTGTAAGVLEGRKVAASAGSVAIAGTAAALTWNHPLSASSGALNLTGTAAGVYFGRKLGAGVGSVAVTGTVAGLLAARILGAGSGSLALAGTAASLRLGQTLAAGSGSVTLGGTSAGLFFGRKVVASAGAASVSGTAAGLLEARRLGASPGAVALTGTAATLARGRTLAADAGAVTVAGTVAGLRATRLVSASTGSVLVTGTTAGLRATHLVTATPGAVGITGGEANLVYTPVGAYALSASPGAVSVAGSSASLEYSRRLAADGGSCSVSSPAAGVLWGRVISVDSGALVVTGTAASLRAARQLAAGPGALTLSGTAAALRGGRKLTADVGSLSVSGAAAAIVLGRRLGASSASVSLSGADATLQFSRELKLTADPGQVVITGTAVARAAAVGSVRLDGRTARLIWSARPERDGTSDGRHTTVEVSGQTQIGIAGGAGGTFVVIEG